jgi:hypothetical protein
MNEKEWGKPISEGAIYGAGYFLGLLEPRLKIPFDAWQMAATELRFKRHEDFFKVLIKAQGAIELNLKENTDALVAFQRRFDNENAITQWLSENMALLEKAAYYAEHEPQDSKISILATACARITSPESSKSYSRKVTLLDTLDTLTEEDFDLLGRFHTSNSTSISSLIDGYKQIDPFDDSKSLEQLEAIYPSITKLDARGLIGLSAQGFDGGDIKANQSAENDWLNKIRSKSYILTPFGIEIIVLIKS